MYVRKINQSDNFYKDYLRQSRIKAVEEHGLQVNESSIDLLPFATYFGLFINNRIVGFLETYLYDEAFGGYKNNFLSNHFDLSIICPSSKMSHVRTVFIEKKFRKSSPYFVYLYFIAQSIFMNTEE